LARQSKKTDIDSVLKHFFNLQKSKPDQNLQDTPPPFGPIFHVLNRAELKDLYIFSLASRILTTFITKFPEVSKDTVENAFNFFVELLQTKQKQEDPPKYQERSISLALVGLRPLLAVNDFRAFFVSDTIQGLPILVQLSTFEDRREEVPMAGNGPKPKKKWQWHDQKRIKKDQISSKFMKLFIVCGVCLLTQKPNKN